MEKIKKAMQEAREQRDSLQEKSSTSRHVANNYQGHVLNDESKVSKTGLHDIVSKIIAVDPKTLEENKILCSLTPISVQRAYKMLRTRFLQQIKRNNWNSIAVISPTSRDGKTLTAINLCLSIAQDPNHTSLLVDFDLLQPSVYEYFDFHPEVSVSECLQNEVPIEKCLVRPSNEDFVMAPSTRIEEGTSEILASQMAMQFAQETKQKYHDRVILYDLPPILVCDDALSFIPNVDAVLLVIREGKTKRTDVEAATNILAEKPIVGVVLNDSKYGISDYYY